MRVQFFKRKKFFAACLLAVSVLSGCHSSHASSGVPVSIHAVNYSDQEIEYYLQDPANESNSGGGESINRFAAGGIMCCYTLPKKWQPGSKARVVYDVVFPAKNGGKIETKKEVAMVDIPEYVAPQELWLVRDVEGSMSIVLSNVEPGHPNWPGLVKGWPVPTLAYQRERADIVISTAKSNLEAAESLFKKMQFDPDKTAKEMWEFSQQYDRKSLSGYTGYKDKRYQEFLRVDLRKSVSEGRSLVKKLEEERP